MNTVDFHSFGLFIAVKLISHLADFLRWSTGWRIRFYKDLHF